MNLTMAHVTEQSAESSHKNTRNTRRIAARKTNTESNLSDTFRKALEKSDPRIVSIYASKRWASTKRDPLPKELVEMLEIQY